MTDTGRGGRGRLAPELALELESVGKEQRMLVGGARMLLAYSRSQVQLQLRRGRLTVCGDGLELLLLADGRLQLMGEVEEIRLEKAN